MRGGGLRNARSLQAVIDKIEGDVVVIAMYAIYYTGQGPRWYSHRVDKGFIREKIEESSNFKEQMQGVMDLKGGPPLTIYAFQATDPKDYGR